MKLTWLGTLVVWTVTIAVILGLVALSRACSGYPLPFGGTY